MCLYIYFVFQSWRQRVAYELIMKRIMQLSEQDQVDIMTSFQVIINNSKIGTNDIT